MSDQTIILRLKTTVITELILMACLIAVILARGAMASNPFTGDTVPDSSGDVIGIRVIPNPNHNSPYSWYLRNAPNQGSPSSLTVDGYDAVRDGRTVYVNAANIEPSTAVDDGAVYTNIYVISYNQNSDPGTTDIFGQLLSFWKFNVNLINDNIAHGGKCLPAGNAVCNDQQACGGNGVCENGNCVRYCLLSSDCASDQYCDSKKARLIRDVRRQADLYEANLAVEQYYAKNKAYPILDSGSYMPGKSLSVWPSWRETLAKQLNVNLPIDPINKLGVSPANFDQITGWDEAQKRFATDFAKPVLPVGSLVYFYQWLKGQKTFQLCANYETSYQGLVSAYSCGDPVSVSDRSTKPQITFGDDLVQNEGPFVGYFRIDADYDVKSINIAPLEPNKWSAWDGWNFGGHGGLWYDGTNDDKVKKISAVSVKLPIGNPFAFYTFMVTVTDAKNNVGSGIGRIRICSPKNCEVDACGQMPDNCGGTLICPDCSGGRMCDTVNHVCR